MKELVIGLTLGATLAGSFNASFGVAQRSLASTIAQVGKLNEAHKKLGEAIKSEKDTSVLAKMNSEYAEMAKRIQQATDRQNALSTAIQKQADYKMARQDNINDLKTVGAQAVSLAAPVSVAVKLAADYEQQVRDIRITSGFDSKAEAGLSAQMRKIALETSQDLSAVAEGANKLVTGGIGGKTAEGMAQLKDFTRILSRTAVATGADSSDLANTMIALRDNMGIKSGKDMQQALQILAYQADQGQFELKDSAKWIPQLSPMLKSFGMSGNKAIAELGAMLTIAKKGAGTTDAAGNNLQNFLTKITAPDTKKDFKKAGIDLEASLKTMVSEGKSAPEAMLDIINKYMTKKGGKALSDKYVNAMAIKDDGERERQLNALGEAYKLGDLFQDMQAMGAIRPLLQNRAELKSLQSNAMKKENQTKIDDNFALRTSTSNAAWQRIKVQMQEIGITVGSTLLPAISNVLAKISPMLTAAADFAKNHSGAIKTMIGLAAGVIAFKGAILIAKIAWMGTFGGMIQQAKVFHAIVGNGGLASKLTGIKEVFGKLGAYAKGTLGMMMKMGKVIIGGITAIGRAFMFLGRMLLMNPIGLAITAIAVGAYLIYRYWDKILPFFQNIWVKVKSFFSSGILNISQTITNWSPLGLFYKAFAGVFSWFGVKLPATFTGFGGMIIGGLVKGFMAGMTKIKEVVGGIASAVSGTFKSALGIASPSKVFLGFGQNIGDGVVIGLNKQTSAVIGASKKLSTAAKVGANAALTQVGTNKNLSTATKASLAQAAVNKADAKPRMDRLNESMAKSNNPSTQNKITFSPVININGSGNPQQTQAAVQQAIKISETEFKQMMDRYQRQQSRVGYA